MNEIQAYERAAQLLIGLNKGAGGDDSFRIEQTSCSERVVELEELVNKKYFTPLLDPRFNDFTEENFFWLALWHEDKVVGVGGARYDEIGKEAVTKFWRRVNRRVYGDGQGDDPTTEFSYLCDECIGGKLVYFGDLYFRKDYRGIDNQSRLQSFLSLAHLAAWSRWKYDYVYAFLRPDAIFEGKDRLYGFYNCIPEAQKWNYSPKSRGSDEWCVYMRRSQVPAMLKYQAVQTASRNQFGEVENAQFPSKIADKI